MLRRTAKLAISCALTAGLVLSGSPCVAYAVTSAELQAQLNDAQTHLGELYEKAEQASEELNDTRVQIDDTNKRIDENVKVANQKQQEIMEEQQVMLNQISDAIKSFVDQYNEQMGYAMIIATQGDILPMPVVTASADRDITDALIEGLNAAYVKEKGKKE